MRANYCRKSPAQERPEGRPSEPHRKKYRKKYAEEALSLGRVRGTNTRRGEVTGFNQRAANSSGWVQGLRILSKKERDILDR